MSNINNLDLIKEYLNIISYDIAFDNMINLGHLFIDNTDLYEFKVNAIYYDIPYSIESKIKTGMLYVDDIDIDLYNIRVDLKPISQGRERTTSLGYIIKKSSIYSRIITQ